ncbi:MAG: POTRA domain-containing protein [Bacteroidota bacterium]
MKRSAIAIIFSIPLVLSSQQIASISFEGLKKTKESYVRQFVTVQVGDRLDSVQLERDRKTLTNLEIFGNALVKVYLTTEGDYEVIFWCNELFTLLPIFSFGGIEGNFWIQTGFSEANLGGGGNKLTAYYQYYDRSSIAAHLTFERIKRSNWGANLSFVKWSTLEPLFFSQGEVQYEYDNWTFGATAIRYFQFRDKVEFGGAYFTEDYTRVGEGFSDAPLMVSEKKILGKVLYTIDRVNYHFFYLDGVRNQLNFQTVRSIGNDPAFYIMFNDLIYHRRINEKGNFAMRFRFGVSSNEESPFAPFVLDSYLNIRGVGNRVDRGTGAIILNTEYRHTMLEKEKMAIQGVIFSDTGSWRNPGGTFNDFTDSDNFVLFAGGGLRLIHKKIYNAIFRVDYGINLQETEINGFVLGVGQYF